MRPLLPMPADARILRRLLSVPCSMVQLLCQLVHTASQHHNITTLQPPPNVNRAGDGPSPTSVLENVFFEDPADCELADPSPSLSSHDRDGLIGFIPKSNFLCFAREKGDMVHS